MIRIESNPVTPLSDGHFMVHSVKEMTCSVMWAKMSAPQRHEFEILYGEEGAFDGFKNEILESPHREAFYCGCDLTCLMWAGWSKVGGESGKLRTLGCVCSEWALRHPLNFCKHSKEVRDAFMRGEPDDVREIYVFIDDTFKSSKNWAARICGLKEYSMAKANGSDFVCYRHVLGED